MSHLDHAATASERLNEETGRAITGAMNGWRLSEREYSILVALDVRFVAPSAFGLSTVADYELFDNLHYEDESWTGYLNLMPAPALEPPDPEGSESQTMLVGISVGRHPEDCRIHALREGQRRFFEQHMPWALARFRQ